MRRGIMTMVLAGSLASTIPAVGQPVQWNGPLTQAQVVARAQQSFDAQLAQFSAQSAAAQAQSARAQALPQLSVSGTAMNSSLVQLGMPSARQTYGSLNATVPLFAPQAWAGARAAGYDAYAARATAAMDINQAVMAAVQQYDAAGLAQAIVQQRTIDVQDQQSHLKLTTQQVRAGAAPRYLIARDQAALAQAEQSEENARADAVRARHALEVLLDLDVTSKPGIALESPSVTFTPDVSALEQRAYAQRPDVVASQRTLLAAQQRVTRARAAYLPAISATAQTYNGFSNPPLGGTGAQVGISASLPLFDAGTRSADVQLARVDYDRAQVQLDRTRLQAQADVLDAVRDFQAAQRNVITANTELMNANVERRIAQVRERAGKGIELETLDALAAVANAREDVVRAQARYADSLAALHRAVGDYAPPSY